MMQNFFYLNVVDVPMQGSILTVVLAGSPNRELIDSPKKFTAYQATNQHNEVEMGGGGLRFILTQREKYSKVTHSIP